MYLKPENVTRASQKGALGDRDGTFRPMGSVRPGHGVYVRCHVRNIQKMRQVVWGRRYAACRGGGRRRKRG